MKLLNHAYWKRGGYKPLNPPFVSGPAGCFAVFTVMGRIQGRGKDFLQGVSVNINNTRTSFI